MFKKFQRMYTICTFKIHIFFKEYIQFYTFNLHNFLKKVHNFVQPKKSVFKLCAQSFKKCTESSTFKVPIF